jgi:hypothetical protein
MPARELVALADAWRADRRSATCIHRNEASDMWSKEMIEGAKAKPAASAMRAEAI